MRFGRFPVEAGLILAHTHRLSTGVLKKGRTLSAEDAERLRTDGHRAITAARLEASDVHEDAAAARVAAALVGVGVRVADAKTGRANLLATHRGLLCLERDAVHALNEVDEGITLATLPPDRQVEAGDMIATVKIIPFAVSADAVEAAEAAARPFAVAPLHAKRVALVLTRLPGFPEAVLAKAGQAQRQRVRMLGGTVVRELRCEHQVEALAERLASLDEVDVVLVLGASAIVDRRDVIPAAVEATGGQVVRLGMPVDPGNLLMLATRGEQAIVGVPGCARSLAPSGFDTVLARVFADVPVTSRDVARLGPGGLLDEIRERPSPRHPRPGMPGKVVGVVLAAGRSRRMGADNKLLTEVDGIPMVGRAVDALAASRLDEVVVVTGHDEDAVKEVLAGRKLTFVHNPHAAEGMGTSVRAAVGALPPCDGVLFALGDMPWVRPDHVDRLLEAFRGPDAICVPTFEGKRGNPVLWGKRWLPQLRALEGDVGARRIMGEHPEAVVLVPMPDGAVLFDVDTPDALAAARRGP